MGDTSMMSSYARPNLTSLRREIAFSVRLPGQSTGMGLAPVLHLGGLQEQMLVMSSFDAVLTHIERQDFTTVRLPSSNGSAEERTGPIVSSTSRPVTLPPRLGSIAEEDQQ